jgi:hypothetical protein
MRCPTLRSLAFGFALCWLVPAMNAQQGANSSARESRKIGEQLQKESRKRAKVAQNNAQQRQKQVAKDIKNQHKARLQEIKRKTKERKRQGQEVDSQATKSQPDAPPKRKAVPPPDSSADPLEGLREYGGTKNEK